MTLFDTLLTRGAVLAISGYRKYLSPYKGYSCAHRVLHGGDSCSMHIQKLVQEHGWKTAWQLAPERFAQCKAASNILSSQCQLCRRRWDNTKRRCGRKCNDCPGCDTLDPCQLLFDGCLDCGPTDKGCIDVNPCDCHPCS
jgi:putative component of membrane protein insertase Oxa1/YidC/SpoIIIJ protein YidD